MSPRVIDTNGHKIRVRVRERERERERQTDRQTITHGLPLRKEIFWSCKNMTVSERLTCPTLARL